MSHKMKSGDSLVKIARRYGITLSALLAANPAYKATPVLLYIDDELDIPGQSASSPVVSQYSTEA